jgi:hypothetical protein
VTAGCFDDGRSLRGILLRVTVIVDHIDLPDEIDGRLGLGVKALNRDCADRYAGEHR